MLFYSKGNTGNSKMGDKSDKKKNMGHLFFHEESIYEISKHYHTWFETYAIHMKATNGQKLQRAITPTKLH